MNRKDYEREAILLSELASLAMKKGDYGKAEEYLDGAKSAIANARIQPKKSGSNHFCKTAAMQIVGSFYFPEPLTLLRKATDGQASSTRQSQKLTHV